ncbi:methionyl-tRNA synthetase [Symbiobacterium terraclitae]|uniref:Methionine--tRNA ligase n=1 Tax=Symbiobacterium terraclitae TaxID=557451 RepID=A0ABS4JUE6_9FIRM|nr:methionine--tRNA ligase [Symbiobacterium terraclitae]MBP2018496.1 methionyl-tRNA synthetase [Symbiobacterium terraclitae]
MSESVYLTTSIFYANGLLHIGHAYEAVAADVLARYYRARGCKVWFLTGTDEHGINIQRRAAAHGAHPQDWVDRIAAADRLALDRLGISYDDFIRTSEERHRTQVQAIFTRLYEQGDIYKDEYEGWYCQYEESFWTESKLIEGRLCPECGRPVEWAKEAAYKFRLTRYAPVVGRLLAQPGFLTPDSRRNEMLTFLREGLEDFAVSRTSVDWGIPVPFDPEHRIYVWLDALANYLTALGYAAEDDRLFHSFWPAARQLVGKDIARFHAIYWPALLAALGLEPPRQIWAHGWFHIDGEKISKSRGNGVDPVALVSAYGVDPVRYYLLRELPYAGDAEWSEEALVRRVNTDLANDLGNLLSRTTQLINKFAGGRVPAPVSPDGVLRLAAEEALAALEAALEGCRLADALAALWQLVRRANKYVDERAPWSLARDPARSAELADVLYSLAESLRIAAAALVPFLVETPERIYAQLGLDPSLARSTPWSVATAWGGLPPGTAIRRGEPLFPRR